MYVINQIIMSKSQVKGKNKEEKSVLSATPEKLIDLLITNSKARKRASAQFEHKGSKQEQLLTTLLLQRLYKLTAVIEKNTGTPFELQQGFALINKKKEDRFLFPMPVPIRIDPGLDYKKVAKALLHLPEHNALTFTICMQVIEWVIRAAENTPVTTLPFLIHSEQT